jgi:hypothetical protein
VGADVLERVPEALEELDGRLVVQRVERAEE